MVSQPLVSVVVPTYNAESFLGATIRSVTKQTYKNWELLIVDDCSTDGTADLARTLATNDDRVQLIALKTNSNLPAVPRNEGIGRSRGDLIAFLDHDDLWFRRKLERHIAAHRRNEQLAMTHSTLLNYPNHFDFRQFFNLPAPVRPMTSHQRLLLFNTVMCSAAVVKRDVLSEIGGFSEDPDLRAIEDYDLWLRVSRLHSIGYLPEILGLYRHQPASTYSSQSVNTKLAALHERVRADDFVAAETLRSGSTRRLRNRLRGIWYYGASGPVRGHLGWDPQIL